MTTAGHAEAPIQRVTAGNGIDYAYRDLGESDLPLVLLQHLHSFLDEP